MKKINKMSELLSTLYFTRGWWVCFPFSLIGFIFVGLFYLVSPLYMLFDFAKIELSSILKPNDSDSNGTQMIKHLFGFMYIVIFNFIVTVFAVVMAMFYFLSSISFFVSSFGAFKVNPFGFHEIKED